MAALTQFEDFKVWQKARELCREINLFSKQSAFSKDYKRRDQINASSGSIMDNIAEGCERGGRNEFIQFLSVAKSSAAETISQLYRALDRDYNRRISGVDEQCIEISKMIKG